MAPFFSVIIPVYNRAPALGRAIESVLAQTCQDFEIVVVDDGSRDDPRSVAQSFGDPRIRFIAQENEGGGVARNTAIDNANGRFIAPLDSDDSFLPHGRAEEPLADRQPIVLTQTQDRPNNAQALFLIDGAEAGALDAYERCVLLFDGRDPSALAQAREQWKAFKAAGLPVSYWRQGAERGWEKQA